MKLYLFKSAYLVSPVIILLVLATKGVYAQDCSVILKIKDPVPVCSPSTIDLTSGAITTGSTSGLTFSYYSNPELTIVVPSPTKVNAGAYYIKGELKGLCNGIIVASVKVTVFEKPNLIINKPDVKSVNGTTDLTSALITSGSDAELIFSYWSDEAATKPLPTPQSTVNGIYFIKGTSVGGCSDIKSIIINNQ